MKLPGLIRKTRYAIQTPEISYENLSLDLKLDLLDVHGEQAVVYRRQRVRFLSAEAGILTNPVWGRGEQLKRHEVTGAESIGSRAEGDKEILLLGLSDRPARGTIAKVESERLVVGGYKKAREYFEVAVERPTEHLGVRIVFPKGRSPQDAVLVTKPGLPPKKLLPRLTTDGRPTLSWNMRGARAGTSYSIRWSW
jgi:hypothetical protein